MASGVGSGVNLPPFPTPPSPSTTDGTFDLIQKYRAAIAKWAGDVYREMSMYADDFSRAAGPNKWKDATLASPDATEADVLTRIKDTALEIKDKTMPLIDALSEIAEEFLVTNKPSVDMTTFLQNLMNAVNAYLSSSADNEDFRNLLKSIVDLVLLDSTFVLTSSDISDVDTTVNNFITRAKSEADTQFLYVDRQNINDLIAKGIFQSDMGANLLQKLALSKARAYAEIDARAEELRRQLLNDAWQRLFMKVELRIRAGSILPADLVALPSGIFSLLGEVLRRVFPDPQNYALSLPGILLNALNALVSLADHLQRERATRSGIDNEINRNITSLFNVISSVLQSVAEGAAKMATFEAS